MVSIMPLFGDATAGYLNQRTDHLVNWNRPGGLFFSNHQYSNRELLERGFVIASMAVGGYMAAGGGVLCCVFGASLAFTVAHGITMAPLIHKRLKAKWACDELVNNLKEQIKFDDEFGVLVSAVIDQVMAHVASTSPSAVWGKRQRLLETLTKWFNGIDHEELSSTLKDEDIISLLDRDTLSSGHTLTG